MNIFCDTNVLVAAVEATHPHHNRAKPILDRIAVRSDRGFVAMHSLAEVYAALTRLPLQPKIHPQDAKRMVEVNVLGQFEIVPVHRDDYLEAMSRVVALGLPGAQIYDALILQSAIRSRADRIYTFSVSDFRMLTTQDVADRICLP